MTLELVGLETLAGEWAPLGADGCNKRQPGVKLKHSRVILCGFEHD